EQQTHDDADADTSHHVPLRLVSACFTRPERLRDNGLFADPRATTIQSAGRRRRVAHCCKQVKRRRALKFLTREADTNPKDQNTRCAHHPRDLSSPHSLCSPCARPRWPPPEPLTAGFEARSPTIPAVFCPASWWSQPPVMSRSLERLSPTKRALTRSMPCPRAWFV